MNNLQELTAGLSVREIEKEIDRLLAKADKLSKILEERREQLADDERRAIAMAAERTRRVLRRTA